MRDERIKVLQIVGNARLGGVSACILNYFRRTDKSKFRFDFVTYGPSSFDEQVRAADSSSQIYYISPFQKNFFKAMMDMEKICSATEYDVVHSHLTTLSAFSLTAAKHAGVPVRICHAHSTFDKNSDHFLIKKLLRPFAADCATHLMACSIVAAQNIFGKQAGRTYILPDAIEAERFYSDATSYKNARIKLNVRNKTVLFVGRYVYQKNIPLLMRAFAKAAASEDMTLAIVGDGEDREQLLSLAQRLKITDKVKFVPPSDPADWYKAADVFCLPSRYEGLGMTAIEAQTAGLKCLLSEHVPQETDISGNCIFLPDDEDAWAAELNRPAPHFYDCRQKIESAHYDIANEAHRLSDFYIRALRET